MASTLDVERARKRLAEDTPFWARHCATILTADKQPVRLEARPWQLEFDAALEKQRAAGLPQRAIILKARKLGFSTWVQAKFMQRITQRPFEYAMVAAQDRKTAGILMDMAVLIYKRLPSEEDLGLGFSIRPQVIGEGQTRTGSRWMSLGARARPEEGSIYETLTAGSGSAGRGFTPSMFHGSEVAHWDDIDFLVGALNAIPKTPNTIAVLESTANGFNHFHDRWQRAVEGAEDPETGGTYVPLFFGWQDNPFNRIEFANDAARERFMRTIGDPAGGGDEEEPALIDRFGLDAEQLRWRRVTMSEECEGKIELFHQEHPTTPEEAFIGSGNPVFSSILIGRMLGEAAKAPEPAAGVLRAADVKERRSRAGSIEVPTRALWVPDTDRSQEDEQVWGGPAPLLVWEHPVNEHTQAGLPEAEVRPDGQYVVFCDVAQGVSSTTEARDYTVIQVLDHVSLMQVARYRSRIDIHDLPLVLLLVAIYFNNAILAPEATGLGIGPVDTLAKDYRYPYLYRRRRRGDDQRADGNETPLLGWYTSPQSKPLMEITFGEVLKAGDHGLRDMATGREFTTYVEEPGDRARHGALKGSYDDMVMAYMGAHRVAAEMRPRGSRGSGRMTGHEQIPGA